MRPRFRILGPLEVEGVSALGGPKQRALLARLALEAGRVVPVERLVDDLWPDEPPETARHALQVYVSTLRRAVGSDSVRGERGGYVLEVGADEVDASRFERLAGDGARALERGDAAGARVLLTEALGLWRGSALHDVGGSLAAERARLDAARLAALEDRIEADLELGRHDELIAELEQLVRDEPLRERPRRQLMLALYRSGRQADALAAYRDARRTLVADLGLEPSAELRELEGAMLRQEEWLDVEPAELRARRRLPAPATALIGRRREVGELSALLRNGARLVTLTGPGGTGKTRLALQAAHELAASFDDGAVFVGLAALRDPDLVPAEIAATLQLEDVGDPLRALTQHLRDRRELLVLDNFEQVDEAAPALRPLLEDAPGVKLLVTSRHTLRLYGEHEYPVPPLALDEEAVPLFVERARATGRPVQPSDEVRELCLRLDGLPLAIELVAARVRELSPAEMLETIPRRLELAARGPRDVPTRQQTLRQAIAWSYELLGENEQAVFARLAVFAGGCTRAAAELIVGAAAADLEALAGKSLLAERDGRFQLLETIREYATEVLDERGDAEDVRRRHARFFVELAERAEPGLRGGDTAGELARLDAEHDNVRAALAWAQAQPEGEVELRLAAAFARYWWLRGHLREGRAALERALARSSDAPSERRVVAHRGAAAIAMAQGAHDDALAHAEHAVELSRRSDHAVELARSLNGLGNIAVARGDHARARAVFDESIELARESSDERVLATLLSNAGNLALNEGDYERATALARESIALAEKLGQREGVAIGRLNIGVARILGGHTTEALQPLRESIEEAAGLGYLEVVAYGLVALAATLADAEADAAARLLGAGEGLLKRSEATLEPAERGLRERTLSTLRRRLGDKRLEHALAQGRSLAAEEAVELALLDSKSVPKDNASTAEPS
jgi:predicted ATPase/DNA-binding SARP family transcriptional activator